jgi:two-component system OmpR family sensor kinase
MFVMPGKETVPFHFVWISLSLVYGLQPWSLSRTYLVLAAVGIVTGAALIRHVQHGVIGWEETTEVPLMSMVFLAMVWHVRRRAAANAKAQALAESERRMRDAQRRFVRIASHELRTPLTVACGYAELIRSEHQHPQVGEDVDVVLDELDKLQRIAERLLTLAKVEEPSQLRVEQVDLDTLL